MPDHPTDEGAPPRRKPAPGPLTIASGVRASEIKRAKDLRAEDKEENIRTDARVDSMATKAITTLEDTTAAQRLQMRMMAAVIVLLICAVLVLAGHAVGISIPGVGEFSGGQGTQQGSRE